MSEVINSSIKKIATGSLIVVIGTLFNLLFGFICRIIFVRYTSLTEYGVYSIAITIIGIFTTLATLGLDQGSTRYIAYFRGKEEKQNIQDIIYSSVILGIITSILFVGISYTSADFIATRIYKTPEIATILKMISITIPFAVLTSISTAIYRGFDKVNENVYFNYLFKNMVYLTLLVIAIFFGFSFTKIVYSYVLSILLTGSLITFYLIKKPPFEIKWYQIRANQTTKELLINSIPLLTVSTLILVMLWTDTLMIGYFKTPNDVAAYNAAYPIAHLLSIVVTSIAFLYMPIASRLYSKNEINALEEVYALSTKWCFILTLPIFFVMFTFPDFVLNVLFGSRYIIAGTTLQVLAVGCLLDSYFGFNYYTLLSAGKSYDLLKCSLVGAITNVLLNMIFIPKWNIIGAAIASVLSFALIEAYMTIKLFDIFKIHPFNKSYMKTTIVSVILIIGFYIKIKNTIFEISPPALLLYLGLFVFLYVFFLILTNSVDKNDMLMLKGLERKIEKKISSAKKVRAFYKN